MNRLFASSAILRGVLRRLFNVKSAALSALCAVALSAVACGQPAGGRPNAGQSASPDPRTDASTAYDSATGDLVLFGGVNRSGTLDDIWTWNGRFWQRQHPLHSPPGREFGVMAFDPASNGLILFGGLSCPPPKPDDTIGCEYVTSPTKLADTWTWNGHDWSSLQTKHSPSVPYFWNLLVGAGADLAHRQLILLSFGSPVPTANTETWTLEGGDWVQLHPAHAPPDLAFGGPAFDAASAHLIVQQSAGPHIDCFRAPCGPSLRYNTTWAWDGSDWQDLGANIGTPPDSGTLLADGKRGLVLIGGATAAWNGSRWTQTKPVPWGGQLRTGWTGAFDAQADRLVLFGGRIFETNHLFGDTLGWDGKSWTTLATAPASPSTGPLALCSPAKADKGYGSQVVANAPTSLRFDLDFGEPQAGPCHLDTVVHFTLAGPSGNPLPITGNPAQIEVVADLTFDFGQEWATFTVTNACSFPDGTVAQFTADDLHATEPVVALCTGAAAPMSMSAGVLHRPDLK